MTEQYTGKAGRKALTDTQKQDKQYAEKPKDDSLKAASFLPHPPATMCDTAKAEWMRVGEYLLRTGRVAKLDSQALAYYANSYATFADAARPLMVGRDQMWGFVRGRMKPAKLVDVMVQHGWIALKMARKFGMTARTRHLDHKYGAGRPATPDQIHAVRGTGKDGRKPRASAAALAASSLSSTAMDHGWPADAVAMPGWLSSAATAEWRRLVDQLEVLDLWTPLDVGPITVLVACYTLAGKCAEKLADSSLVVPIEGSEGAVEHAASVIYRQLFEICESCWMDYGMSPFDRLKFSHVEGEQQGKPKLAVFPGEMA